MRRCQRGRGGDSSCCCVPPELGRLPPGDMAAPDARVASGCRPCARRRACLESLVRPGTPALRLHASRLSCPTRTPAACPPDLRAPQTCSMSPQTMRGPDLPPPLSHLPPNFSAAPSACPRGGWHGPLHSVGPCTAARGHCPSCPTGTATAALGHAEETPAPPPTLLSEAPCAPGLQSCPPRRVLGAVPGRWEPAQPAPPLAHPTPRMAASALGRGTPEPQVTPRTRDGVHTDGCRGKATCRPTSPFRHASPWGLWEQVASWGPGCSGHAGSGVLRLGAPGTCCRSLCSCSGISDSSAPLAASPGTSPVLPPRVGRARGGSSVSPPVTAAAESCNGPARGCSGRGRVCSASGSTHSPGHPASAQTPRSPPSPSSPPRRQTLGTCPPYTAVTAAT